MNAFSSSARGSSALPVPATAPRERALVLGGGGSTGNAWLIGVVAGLFEAGLDVSSADLTVGTSAGSTAAAQLACATPAELYEATLAAVPPARPARPAGGPARPAGGTGGARSQTASVIDFLDRTDRIIAASSDAADMRRRLGAAALELEAESDADWSRRWRSIVAARFPGADWPERAVRITAMDARTGEPVVFDRGSGVALVDAVAASCSSGLPYAIGEGRYLDGGYRTNAENADLAAAYERVLVLSPFGGRTRTPFDWGLHLATQVDDLRARGSRVETVFPEPSAEHLFGPNAMDFTLRPAAARAGHAQARSLAPTLTPFWT